MDTEASKIAESINALVDEYRARCLWFLRSDYYPAAPEDQIRILGYIARYGDVEAYRRAAALREWLSHHFNAASAGS
jgi:hypothetical protein